MCYAIYIIYVEIVSCQYFSQTSKKSYGPCKMIKFLFTLNNFRSNGYNFTNIYICIHIEMIYDEIVSLHSSQICNRVVALN